MRIRWPGFNTILCSALILATPNLCQAAEKTAEKPAEKKPEKKAEKKPGKLFTTLRVHLETNRDGTDKTTAVPIYRLKPVMITVEAGPFVTEANVSEARVIEVIGGFALQLKFERRGTWLLESYTTANRGRRFAIFCEFQDPADPKKTLSRWLGAPIISERITDGVLTFTPDASREECDNISAGLNKLAKKLDDKYKW